MRPKFWSFLDSGLAMMKHQSRQAVVNYCLTRFLGVAFYFSFAFSTPRTAGTNIANSLAGLAIPIEP